MASIIFRLNSSSDYLNANYFDPKDNNIYVHRLVTEGPTTAGKERWEYTAAIGETQEFKEIEVSPGVVIGRGDQFAELVRDLRPITINAAANHGSSRPATSFYSLRVNNQGRCYVRREIVGDCLHGSKLNAIFDWSKYDLVPAKTTTAEKGKEDAHDARVLEKTKKPKEEEEEEEKKESGSGGEEEEEAGYCQLSSTSKEGGAGRPGLMDFSAVFVVVFYFLGLYYWGAKLLAILFRRRSQNTHDDDAMH